MSTSVDDFWAKLEWELSEHRVLFNMRLETKAEAKGRRRVLANGKPDWNDTAPRWHDEEIGLSVRPWFLIPHVDAVDHEAIAEWLEAGRRLVDLVKQRIAARELTPELLHDWGLLNKWAGAIELVYHMEPDARLLRAGDNNLDAHKRWFAHYYLAIQPRRNRENALETMEKFVNSIVNALPDGPEKNWFSRFLGPANSDSLEDASRLTKTFREKLSVTEMEKLAVQPLDAVPQFARDYPHP